MGAKLLAATLIAMLPAAAAHADWFSYPQWEQLPPEPRALYLQGAFDMFTGTPLPTLEASQKRYVDCIVQQKMTAGQLADNLLAFIRAHAELQTLPVPVGMLRYLADLCGPSP